MDDASLYLVQCDFVSLSDSQYEQALEHVDEASQARARRFFHREDAWRFLIGRILRYVVLDRIVNAESLKKVPLVFDQTSFGKPYLVSPVATPAIGFNVSHDSSAILLALTRHEDTSVASEIGIDVMRMVLPQGELFASFLESIASTLTPPELNHLRNLERTDPSRATQALFQLWTLKEAYVKAIGSGLRFDVSRIEYDFNHSTLSVDGSPLQTWSIRSFFFMDTAGYNYAAATCHKLGNNSAATGGLAVRELPKLKAIHPVTLFNLMNEIASRTT